MFSSWEAKRLLRLATPVFLAQIVLVLMTVVDTMMAGQVSAEDLAALSIAIGIWNPILFALQGILLALTGVVAHCHGANDESGIRHYFQQSVYLVLLLSAVGFAVAPLTEMVVRHLDASHNVIQKATDYIDFVKWGMFGFLFFTVYRNVTEGVGLTKPALYISLLGLLLNIPANLIFIYGYFGLPALGSAGCGLATMLVFTFMAILQHLYSLKSKTLGSLKLFSNFQTPQTKELWYLFKLGLPICLATFFEVTLFACIPLFIADLGAIAVSGHQIAASVSTLLFMMPLSLSMAISIRVGNLCGQGHFAEVKTAISTSFLLACLIALFVATVTYLFRDAVASLYSSNTEVLALASTILALACIYQLPDALQVAANGVLRGLKYTKPITSITFISYWLIGFSLGFVLAKTDWLMQPLGAAGFWIGIIVGLSTAAVMLLISVRRRLATLAVS
ncbi:Multi antimicrobial extrusion protein (Na(+)/drug antiporter), MATE family of MDR efflux pumps [Pseudoalteromonas luteoviolacea B = ATCC 29581]|nr:Multi antimicrobial extrusion protein (Na(+)/drug antiporter), MATE family of MDR efflux pumps [Pseudoalteromonas luteoviolacea B = ATCC 29581]